MKSIAVIALVFAVLTAAEAQQQAADMSVAGSVSGQFFVSARGGARPVHSADLVSAPDMVELQPALVVVSCERIKQELLRELGMRDAWQGKIFVVLQPAQTVDDPVSVAPEWFAGNWNCGIQLPDVVDRERFVEVVVRACLLEMANRNTVDHPAQIPEWLAQGFVGQLVGSGEQRWILSPPGRDKSGFNVTRLGLELTDNPKFVGPNVHRVNPLADALTVMQTNPPLTFDELSWPTDDQISGGERDAYRASAQLFVDQLLHLRNGPASMSAMLAELPNYLNWQLAFLNAFQKNFTDSLDVEKWWALQVVQYTGRDFLHLWTPDESWNQMDAMFHFPIEVKIGAAPAMRSEITFQTVIRGWSRTRQLELFRQKLSDLDLLRMHVAPDFMPLVDEYREVLRDYYQQRSSKSRNAPQSGPLLDKIEEDAVAKLDGLDARRAAMQPQPQVPVVSTVEAAGDGGP